MDCPGCQGPTQVKDSRPADHNTIRRRRMCLRCGARFTTYEWAGDPQSYGKGWRDCLKNVTQISLSSLITEEKQK